MGTEITRAGGATPPTPMLTPRLIALAQSCGTIRWPGEEERAHLPQGIVLDPEDRRDAEARLTAMKEALDPLKPDPASSSKERSSAVTKLLATYSAGDVGDLQAAAVMESYADALDDLPAWAVSAAVRRWNRKECGTGKDFNYNFAPRPPLLREIALREVASFKRPIALLERLLKAEPYAAALERRGDRPRGIAPPTAPAPANALRRMP